MCLRGRIKSRRFFATFGYVLADRIKAAVPLALFNVLPQQRIHAGLLLPKA